MPTQPPDQEEKEGRRRGTRCTPSHLKGFSDYPQWQREGGPERAFNPSSKNHRKGGHERRHDPSEWTCARTQDRWPRLIEHHAHPTTRSGRKGRA